MPPKRPRTSSPASSGPSTTRGRAIKKQRTNPKGWKGYAVIEISDDEPPAPPPEPEPDLPAGVRRTRALAQRHPHSVASTSLHGQVEDAGEMRAAVAKRPQPGRARRSKGGGGWSLPPGRVGVNRADGGSVEGTPGAGGVGSSPVVGGSGSKGLGNEALKIEPDDGDDDDGGDERLPRERRRVSAQLLASESASSYGSHRRQSASTPAGFKTGTKPRASKASRPKNSKFWRYETESEEERTHEPQSRPSTPSKPSTPNRKPPTPKSAKPSTPAKTRTDDAVPATPETPRSAINAGAKSPKPAIAGTAASNAQPKGKKRRSGVDRFWEYVTDTSEREPSPESVYSHTGRPRRAAARASIEGMGERRRRQSKSEMRGTTPKLATKAKLPPSTLPNARIRPGPVEGESELAGNSNVHSDSSPSPLGLEQHAESACGPARDASENRSASGGDSDEIRVTVSRVVGAPGRQAEHTSASTSAASSVAAAEPSRPDIQRRMDSTLAALAEEKRELDGLHAERLMVGDDIKTMRRARDIAAQVAVHGRGAGWEGVFEEVLGELGGAEEGVLRGVEECVARIRGLEEVMVGLEGVL